jgi:6-pyruvoyltetrahydropterin/6-carboxytetrahydropterin synthase
MILKPDQYQDLPSYEQEIYEGLVLVNFVPTSENLSKWLHQIIQNKMSHLCKVSQVQFYETPKSQSNYIF